MTEIYGTNIYSLALRLNEEKRVGLFNDVTPAEISDCCSLSNKNSVSRFINRVIQLLFISHRWVDDKAISREIVHQWLHLQSSLLNSIKDFDPEVNHANNQDLVIFKQRIDTIFEVFRKINGDKEALKEMIALQDTMGNPITEIMLTSFKDIKAKLDDNKVDIRIILDNIEVTSTNPVNFTTQIFLTNCLFPIRAHFYRHVPGDETHMNIAREVRKNILVELSKQQVFLHDDGKTLTLAVGDNVTVNSFRTPPKSKTF